MPDHVHMLVKHIQDQRVQLHGAKKQERAHDVRQARQPQVQAHRRPERGDDSEAHQEQEARHRVDKLSVKEEFKRKGLSGHDAARDKAVH